MGVKGDMAGNDEHQNQTKTVLNWANERSKPMKPADDLVGKVGHALKGSFNITGYMPWHLWYGKLGDVHPFVLLPPASA
jgi:hypothetical protein